MEEGPYKIIATQHGNAYFFNIYLHNRLLLVSGPLFHSDSEARFAALNIVATRIGPAVRRIIPIVRNTVATAIPR